MEKYGHNGIFWGKVDKVTNLGEFPGKFTVFP